MKKTALKKDAWLVIISLSIHLAFSAMYEIIEWLSTKVTTSKQHPNDSLGMQGDHWDAQWDMSLALLGAVISLIVFAKLYQPTLKKDG